MESSYDIFSGQRKIGTVTAAREGLYYHFRCRCNLPDEQIYRLMVRCGANEESLGVLLPSGDCFGLDKRISVKQLGQGALEFYLKGRSASKAEKFIPVYPEEPFAYIARLKDAYLDYRGSQVGIVIKDRSQDPPGSGRNP